MRSLMLISPTSVARVAGALYVVGSLGFVLGMVLHANVVEAGDAAATTDNLRASEPLVRAAIALGLVSSAAWVCAVVALYQLLQHVNRPVAALMVVFVGLALAMESLNLVAQLAALRIATGTVDAHGFGQAASAVFVMLLVELQGSATLVAGLFWGLWLLPLGFLVMRSGSFPRVLGAFLILGGSSLLANLSLAVLTGRGVTLLLALDVGELLFVVWLLVKGVRVPSTNPRHGLSKPELPATR
jgi:Domain of unknown function (DUF4386)